MRLGVLGGTFDPPHMGHLLLAQQALEQLALDRVLWVPAGDPWRKAAQLVTPAEHRLAMVELAISGNEAFEVSRLEVDRPGASYTAETLQATRGEYADAALFFLCGADALEDLPNWRDPDRIIELATLGVAVREGRRIEGGALDALVPGLGRRVAWFEMPRLDISATDLRARSAAGRSLRYLVPGAVEDYIRGHCQYRAE